MMMFSTVVWAGLPVSREATVLDVSSASEVLLESVGVYKSQEKRKRKRKKDVKRNGISKAVQDAKSAAVYYLLFNGTDPLLADADELERFQKIESDFFTDAIINEAIVYQEGKPHKTVSLDSGQGVKVFVNIKVNMNFVRQVLEENLVIYSKDELVEALGYPQIMVIPVASEGKTVLESLNTDSKKQHAAGVIESYLTSKRYDVIVPNQLETLNKMASSLSNLKGIQVDPAYDLALQIGADVYLQYSIGESKAAYDTDQLSVTVKAFETTTSRLLATETGYSKPRVGAQFVSIEEALLGALNNVTQRIMKYWEQDLNKGVQYKVITYVDTQGLSEEEKEDVIDDIMDVFDVVSNSLKENVTTDNTFDVTMWCDHEQITSSRDLYRKIKDEFKQKQGKLKVKLVNRNRKLILLNLI